MSGAEAVDLTAVLLPDERPAEHLRNTLCLVGALKRELLTLPRTDNVDTLLAGIERRVWRAIEQLEGRGA